MMFLATYWTANPISDNNNGRVSELFTSCTLDGDLQYYTSE